MSNDPQHDDPIEGYCVVCKDKRDMEDPAGVWTSNALPVTRGTCPVCGTTMFRMGRSHLHGNTQPPDPVQVVPKGAKGKAKRAAYVAACITDSELAQRLGHDLKQIGIHSWVDSGEQVDTVKWSTGVHPALEQCSHLIVVLSGFTESTASVREAWLYFKQERKQSIVVQVDPQVTVPDDLRSRPRYDFSKDYKSAFRSLVEALSK
jgi:hypothetical protein